MRARRRPRLPTSLRGVRGVTAGLVLALCGVLATVPGSSAAFTASVVNTTDTLGTNKYFTCQSAMVGDSAYYAYPLDDASPTNGSSARDLSGSSRPGAYQTTATHSTSSPCTRDGGGSTTFNGSTNYVSTPNRLTNPSPFSIEVWFRTTTSSGVLMGFNDALLNAVPSSWDRMIYFTTNGRLTFGVYPNTVVTVTSTNGYADGSWHHVVATLGSAGMFLYVDGAVVASSTNTSAQSYSGYWRVGYDNLVGWPGVVGTNYYYNGQLGHAAVYTTQLSASTVAAHYVAGV